MKSKVSVKKTIRTGVEDTTHMYDLRVNGVLMGHIYVHASGKHSIDIFKGSFGASYIEIMERISIITYQNH